MKKSERPRTKRLERPTPNLSHPVISDKKSNENDLHLEECIEVMNKSRITSSTNVSNKFKVKSNLISTPDNRQQRIKQKMNDNKLNCHQMNDTIKLSILETNKCESLSQKTIEKTINRDNVHKNCETLKNKSAKDSDINDINNIKTPINDSIEAKQVTKEESDWSGWQQFNAQLIPCSHCCRTFFPHRLPVHEKCCKGISLKKITSNGSDSNSALRTSRVLNCMSIECMTCGRKYKTTSLTSHQLKCKTNIKQINSGNNETQNKSVTETQLRNRLMADRKSNQKLFSNKLESNATDSKSSPFF